MVGSERVLRVETRTEPVGEEESHRTVVVMELGATWPSWLGDSIADCGESAVHAQAGGELPSVFATRVVHRVGDVSGSGRIQLAVLAWNSEVTALLLSARFRIARAVIQAMHDVPGAELVISAAAEPADANRHELLGLVAALCEDLSAAKVIVSVTFSSSPAKSGIALRGSVEALDWVGAES